MPKVSACSQGAGRSSSESVGLVQIYAALNAIGEVSWSINAPMYEALMHAWGQRMQIGSMPPQDDQPLRSTPASKMFAVQSTRWPKGQMIVSVSPPPPLPIPACLLLSW